MQNEILSIIKRRASVRRYRNKPVPKTSLDKILQAGIWGPSVTTFSGLQPWKFVVVRNKRIKNRIANIVLKKSKRAGTGVNILLHSAANTIRNAEVLIAVYNSGDSIKLKSRFGIIFRKFSKILKNAELSAISASIQNMIITAESLNLGSCWLDTPLFCEKEINRELRTEHNLTAILTLGYPAEKGRRALRKTSSQSLEYKT